MRYVAYRVAGGGTSSPGALVCRQWTQQEVDAALDSKFVLDPVLEFDADNDDSAWQHAERELC